MPNAALTPLPVKRNTRPRWASTSAAMRRIAPLRTSSVSSASRAPAMAVEPTTSANSTVTWRCCRPLGPCNAASLARNGAAATSSTVSPSVARWASSAAMAARSESVSSLCIAFRGAASLALFLYRNWRFIVAAPRAQAVAAAAGVHRGRVGSRLAGRRRPRASFALRCGEIASTSAVHRAGAGASASGLHPPPGPRHYGNLHDDFRYRWAAGCNTPGGMSLIQNRKFWRPDFCEG